MDDRRQEFDDRSKKTNGKVYRRLIRRKTRENEDLPFIQELLFFEIIQDFARKGRRRAAGISEGFRISAEINFYRNIRKSNRIKRKREFDRLLSLFPALATELFSLFPVNRVIDSIVGKIQEQRKNANAKETNGDERRLLLKAKVSVHPKNKGRKENQKRKNDRKKCRHDYSIKKFSRSIRTEEFIITVDFAVILDRPRLRFRRPKGRLRRPLPRAFRI